MASAKESPRQKMIGMMYLVLTALLALNVSKEILNAFVVVNNGLEKTNANFTQKNEKLYSEFDLAKQVDPLKVTPYWQKAQQTKKQANELIEYIEGLKKELTLRTEGVEKNVADTLKLAYINAKDNYDIPTNYMIGESEDGSAGEARVLKNKLNDYKTKLSSYIDKKDLATVNLDINTPDPVGTEERQTWETHNFYHTPLAAAITILSKLQSDVKNAEYTVVDYLLRKFDTDALKFDTVSAKVIPTSNYVLLGDRYQADIFIAAFSKTQKSDIVIDGRDCVKVEKGLGKYIAEATKEGLVKYNGVIRMKTPKGKEIQYPFESEYIVARPSLNVSADKMNVFYAGLENPVTISVPGVANEKINVTSNNGTLIKTGDGKYMIKNLRPGVSTISVSAMMEDGESRNMGSTEFRVKPLPTPVPKVGKVEGSGSMTKNELLAYGKIQSFYKEFLFEANCKVVSFQMYIMSKRLDIGTLPPIEGNSFVADQNIKNQLNMLRTNDVVIFENIRAVGPDGIVRKLDQSLSIKIK